MSTQPFRDQGHYTSVHDAIFDVLMPVCPPNAWKVVCFIIRKTIGWKKDEDAKTYRQIMKGTGIKSPDTLANALWFLTRYKIIVVQSSEDTWQSNTYSLNRDLTLSDALIEQMRTTKLTRTHSATETVADGLTTETVADLTTETVADLTTETVASNKQGKKQQKKQDDASAPSLKYQIMQLYAELIKEHEQRKIAGDGGRYMRTINQMIKDGFAVNDLPVLAACYRALKAEQFWSAKPLHLESLWTAYGPWKVGNGALVRKLMQNTLPEHTGSAPDERREHIRAQIEHELAVTFGSYHDPLTIDEQGPSDD